MERFDTHKTATKKTVVFGLALVLVALLLLAAYAGLGRPASGEASPVINSGGETVSPPEVPEDETLRLTVPAMARVKDLPVGTGPADDEATLAESALHVDGTGFPWEEGTNVYIAGHRIGYKGEASHLVFYDLDVLQNGDEVILTDADGTRYTYRVFRSFVVDPDDYHVTEPVTGKSVVSLQTCTLPDYSERLVVQAELADVSS
jgi:sortase A